MHVYPVNLHSKYLFLAAQLRLYKLYLPNCNVPLEKNTVKNDVTP